MNAYVGDEGSEVVKRLCVGDEGSALERPIGTVKRAYVGDEGLDAVK